MLSGGYSAFYPARAVPDRYAPWKAGLSYFHFPHSFSEHVIDLPHDSIGQLHRPADLCQQLFHNADPLRIERFPANRLPRSTIPVGCISLIAFFAMQVGVHPRTLGAFVLLRRFVGRCRIVIGIPPETDESECEFAGGLAAVFVFTSE